MSTQKMKKTQNQQINSKEEGNNRKQQTQYANSITTQQSKTNKNSIKNFNTTQITNNTFKTTPIKQSTSQILKKVNSERKQVSFSKINAQGVENQVLIEDNQLKSYQNEIKQSQMVPKEDQKAVCQVEIQSRIKFLDIFKDQIINQIMSFLQLKDLIKIATISRKFRERIPIILKEQDCSQRLNTMYQNQYGRQNQCCQRILIQANAYKDLIKKSLLNIEQTFKEFEDQKIGQKNIFKEILKVSVNFFMKTNKSKYEIINYILSVGVTKAFKALEGDFIIPSQVKIVIPPFPVDVKETPFSQLILSINQYFTLQQEQMESVRFFKLFHYLQIFQEKRQKFIQKYETPIICLKKTSNIFDYVNKNIIQLILPFLNINEIMVLKLSCKAMNEITKQGIISVLGRMNENRCQLLQTHLLTDTEAKAAMYSLHFIAFEKQCEGWISSYLFAQPQLKDMLYILCRALGKENKADLIKNYIKSKYNQSYDMMHDINDSKPDKIEEIDQLLQQYTDEYVETIKIEEGYHRKKIISLQKYLKGIKLYLQLKLNSESYNSITKAYKTHIYKVDRMIYQYEKIIKLPIEQLDILIIDIDNPIQRRVQKSRPLSLFY